MVAPPTVSLPQGRPATILKAGHPATILKAGHPATILKAGHPATILKAGHPAAIPPLATPAATPAATLATETDLVTVMMSSLRVPARMAVPEILQLRDPAEKPAHAALSRVRVLVVENHVLLASTLAGFLNAEADLNVVSVARTGAEAVLVATRETPDVVLMGCRLPDMSGPMAAGLIRTAVPTAVFVFHSAYDSEPVLLDAIDSGAAAYLAKSATADEIVEAVRRAALGEILIPVAFFAQAIARKRDVFIERRRHKELLLGFTPRELEVLTLLAAGLATAAIADQLDIAIHTVEWHVRHLIVKLKVHSQLQAVIEAVRQGIVELGRPEIASGQIALEVHAA
jgi:DNA-binding NarL/FixJ family response regulator